MLNLLESNELNHTLNTKLNKCVALVVLERAPTTSLIAKMLSNGKSNKVIAGSLKVSEEMVQAVSADIKSEPSISSHHCAIVDKHIVDVIKELNQVD